MLSLIETIELYCGGEGSGPKAPCPQCGGNRSYLSAALKEAKSLGKEIKFIATYSVGKSQYQGDKQWQMEYLINGERHVNIQTAKTGSEAKYRWVQHLLFIWKQGKK